MNEIRCICSMATTHLLHELAGHFEAREGVKILLESLSIGEVVDKVKSGAVFDVVSLAAGSIDALIASGHVRPGTRTDIARSGIAMAVKAGAARPDISTEAAFRNAMLSARSIGYSTGPSGKALISLFETMGMSERLKDKLVLAPPGMAVGSLIADGRAELGFQQRGELIHIPGLDLITDLPPFLRIVTIFSGAICSSSTQPDLAARFLAFIASPESDDARRQQGMEPA